MGIEPKNCFTEVITMKRTLPKLNALFLLILGCFINGYSQITTPNGTKDLIHNCKEKFDGLMCDYPSSSCRLNFAIQNCDSETVKRVIDYDGVPQLDSGTKTIGEIPIFLAIITGELAKFKLLFPYLTDKELREKDEGMTSLVFASSIYAQDELTPDQKEIINMLLSSGADINAKDNLGNSPVIFGAKWGNLQLLDILLKNKANPNIQNKVGESSLMVSVDDEIILRRLIKAKADLSLRDLYGRTALFYAIKNCQPVKFNLLLGNNEALLKTKDYQGLSPIDVSKKYDLLNECTNIIKQIRHFY